MTAIPAQVEEIAENGDYVVTPRPQNGNRVEKEVLARLEDPKKRRFLLAFSESAIVRDGCRAAGIARGSCEWWRRTDPLFAKLFLDAREDAYDNLERHALSRAMDPKKPSDILTIFLLKGGRPTKYRDNVSISGHDGGPLFRMVAGVSPQRVCGVEPEPKLTASKAKALLESDATKAAVKPVEPVKS